jgi:hypothetical protein
MASSINPSSGTLLLQKLHTHWKYTRWLLVLCSVSVFAEIYSGDSVFTSMTVACSLGIYVMLNWQENRLLATLLEK